MAKREVVECDKCGREGRTYVLWTEGDYDARSVDLCELHAKTLAGLFGSGSVVDLPSRPRTRMDVTALRTTAKTRGLKKRGTSGASNESQ